MHKRQITLQAVTAWNWHGRGSRGRLGKPGGCYRQRRVY